MHAGRGPRWPWWLGGAVLAVVADIAALVFQPWLLFVDRVIDEQVPTVAPTVTSATGAAPDSSGAAQTASAEPTPVGPRELASGSFASHEHTTSGTARILELDTGERVLVLEDLDTSNGPDLHVWLTDQPVIEGFEGWFVFDDGAWTTLGPLQGNVGTQQYAIPDDLDPTSITSVSIWCEQFAVSFGAAPLALDD